MQQIREHRGRRLQRAEKKENCVCRLIMRKCEERIFNHNTESHKRINKSALPISSVVCLLEVKQLREGNIRPQDKCDSQDDRTDKRKAD